MPIRGYKYSSLFETLEQFRRSNVQMFNCLNVQMLKVNSKLNY